MSEWAVLPILKFVFSKNFLGTVGRSISALIQPPDWKKDFLTFKAKIKRTDRELSSSFREKVTIAMKERAFPETAVAAFEDTFNELARNGFSYGCPNPSDSLGFVATVSLTAVSLEVTNNNRRQKISLTLEDIKERTRKLRTDQVSGRGLPYAYSTADQFDIVRNGRGVKIVIGKREFDVELLPQSSVTIITVGDFFGDYLDIIQSSLNQSSDKDVILVFPVRASRPSTSAYGAAHQVQIGSAARFVIVGEGPPPRFLSSFKTTFPKYEGYYETVEAAISALRPASQKVRGEVTKNTAPTRSKRPK